MISNLIKGTESSANAAKTRGWIAGYFMDPGPNLTNNLEVKLWRYDESFNYGKKKFQGTELIVIYGGKIRLELENDLGDRETLSLSGDSKEYVILPAGLTKEVVVEVAPAYGTTVRWPSAP